MELTPINEKKPKPLSFGQLLLLHQIKLHATENEVMTRKTVLSLYIKAVKRNSTYLWQEVVYDCEKGKYCFTGRSETRLWIDDPSIYKASRAWLNSNLATVIIRGKVSILPKIEP